MVAYNVYSSFMEPFSWIMNTHSVNFLGGELISP